jgi:peptidoglycan hydrolase-like protein with peptidoglycan-binding domain
MRVLILALSALAIFISADAGKAGPSTATRDDVLADDVLASVEPATLTDEATQETEDRIGLDKRKRRDVQRGLTRLGFDTKANGKFDEPTRAVITRWQGARGYPTTGFLNTLQHQALQSEIASAAQASVSGKSDDPAGRRGGGGARHHRSGGGGPGGLIGGVVGGMFR